MLTSNKVSICGDFEFSRIFSTDRPFRFLSLLAVIFVRIFAIRFVRESYPITLALVPARLRNFLKAFQRINSIVMKGGGDSDYFGLGDHDNLVETRIYQKIKKVK